MEPPAVCKVPDELTEIRLAAQALPQILLTGNIRQALRRLPQVDLTTFCDTATLPTKRIAMVHYTFLVQAYVWGEPEPVGHLPACLAVPVWLLGKSLGQPPLLTYSNYVLDNWKRFDKKAPIDLSNICTLQPFLGGQDETWFVLIHVAIEARAGAMLKEIPCIFEAIAGDDVQTLEQSLSVVSDSWDDINRIFDRMPERCDPYIYFQRVRPWIHGWQDNPVMAGGLVYEGVKETRGEPQTFRGQTGAQSSIVPAMDALLGIGHAADPLKVYLEDLHAYRPKPHREFIVQLRNESRLRPYVSAVNRKPLTDLYNDCLMKLTGFRTRHLEYAAAYIHKQQCGNRGNDTEVGTGGTPFMKYLKKHRDEAQAHLL